MTQLNAIPEAVGRLVAARPLKELAAALARTHAATASGLWGSSVAAVIGALRKELAHPIVLVCGHLDEADDLADDIELFVGLRPDVLPALELGGTLGRLSEEQVSNRLQLISRFAAGVQKASMLVAPIQALMQSVPSRQQLDILIRSLMPGQELEPEKLIVWLSEHGYNRLDQVEVPGDFSVRGGLIDVYLPGEYDVSGDQVGLTARIDFFGDQIESIKRFDLDTLGSLEPMQSLRVIDLKGTLPDVGESVSLLSYFPEETAVVLWAPLEIAEQAKSYLDRLPETKGIYPLAAVLRLAQQFALLELSQFDQGSSAMPSLVGGKEIPHFALPIQSAQKFETEAKKALAELAELATTHSITVFCENEGEQKRFAELLDQDQPGLRQQLDIPIGYLHHGFVWDERATWTAASASGSSRVVPPLRAATAGDESHRFTPGGFIPRSEGGRLRRSCGPRHRQVHGDAYDQQGWAQRGVSFAALCRERDAARPGGAGQPHSEIYWRL